MANKFNDSYQIPVLIDDRKSQTQSLKVVICRDAGDFSRLRQREEKGEVNIIKVPLTHKDRLTYAKTRLTPKSPTLPVKDWTTETYLAQSVPALLAESDVCQSLVEFELDNGTKWSEYVISSMESILTTIDQMLPLQPYICRKNGKVVGELMRINRQTTFDQIVKYAGDRWLHTSTLRSLDKLISDDESAYVFNSIEDYNVSKILHHDNVYMEIEK